MKAQCFSKTLFYCSRVFFALSGVVSAVERVNCDNNECANFWKSNANEHWQKAVRKPIPYDCIDVLMTRYFVAQTHREVVKIKPYLGRSINKIFFAKADILRVQWLDVLGYRALPRWNIVSQITDQCCGEVRNQSDWYKRWHCAEEVSQRSGGVFRTSAKKGLPKKSLIAEISVCYCTLNSIWMLNGAQTEAQLKPEFVLILSGKISLAVLPGKILDCLSGIMAGNTSQLAFKNYVESLPKPVKTLKRRNFTYLKKKFLDWHVFWGDRYSSKAVQNLKAYMQKAWATC